ncbi:unnamed protein product [Rotaria sordida]|uniref:G-protein coupled receptors family 1 profile domain-containing protein n=1 Tax=Rotaria sordida TaxID=392033 RepID=A0A814SI92_9BILA|nr:unnamed protein product [Rotaria sordida]CAF1147713.1 unnamed protein product [Rotaria sordida]CAF1202416.1 unnamed protein product [Rotaria sordida]CAF1384055.1 unnamed protein product [Rotaria sordida]CAF3865692.1 unnamed protein product [Rotaria sordida]
MRAMTIFDILMLYGWNIDHYVSSIHGFTFSKRAIPLCKFFSFLNYFAPQSSAWLRVFISLDRYLSLSRLHRTWFGKSKNILIIIACIMIILLLLNFHIFIVVCYYKPNGTISIGSWAYVFYPTWDYVNLAVYNCAPFILMVTFNTGVIYHLIRLRKTSTIQNSRIQHRSISITLVITTSLFLIMTIPATVGYAFFSTASSTILHLLDAFLYIYHVLSFPLYMITFDEFRRDFFAMITCKTNNQRGATQIQTVTVPNTLNTKP